MQKWVSKADKIRLVTNSISESSNAQGRMLRAAYSKHVELAWGLTVLAAMPPEDHEKYLGGSLKWWVETSLVSERDGKPRSWGWARNLMSTLARLKRFPKLLELVRLGTVSWWCADTITRLSELQGWQYAASSDGADERCVAEALLGYCHVRRLHQEARDVTPKGMVKLGGFVTPDIKASWFVAVAAAAAIQDREIPADPSWVWQVETVASVLEDLADAAARRTDVED